MTALLALLVLSQSPTTDAEIFLDRGETYIRAGFANGLEIGSALEVVDAKTRQPAGSALVMEVWESLSRVSLDAKASAHAPLKVARVGRSEPVPGAVAIEPEPQQLQQQPVPAGTLDGYVTMTGVADMRRLIIKNRSTRDWHACDVRLPNWKRYRIGDLDAGDDDGVMLFRFEFDSAAPPVPRFNGVTVICREGVGRFPISP